MLKLLRHLPVIFGIFLLNPLLGAQQQPSPTYSLKPTPKTIAWGYYDATTPPVLRVKSGDTVEIQTLPAGASPAQLEAAGVPPGQVEQSLRDIFKEVTNKGPGAHILTGPVYVEDARPGDVLEIRILSIRLAIPYAYNRFRPGFGYLPDDFPYTRTKIIPLDENKQVAHFAPGIDLPIRPFFGSIGVAPPEVTGRISSGPPWIHGGNMDNKELVAGTTLSKMALHEMIDFLVEEKHLTRDDAYMLCSVAADLSITQLVDGNKGVHASIAKSLFHDR